MRRLYLPATLRVLGDLEREGEVPVHDDAVLAPDDSEEGEYDALMTAADTSAVLAGELEVGERRRVVIVAEVAWPVVAVRLQDVVAVHADAGDLPPGVDPDDLEDLGWYAAQEIPALLQAN